MPKVIYQPDNSLDMASSILTTQQLQDMSW